MEKDFDFVNNGYKCESVIERGYAIYDEWNQKKLKSKQIVRFVENATDLEYTGSTKKTYYEALSCLFALDMRINERYNSLLRHVFLFFSWCREARALKQLKQMLNITKNESVRASIEIRVQQLRENIQSPKDEEDDDVGGGKRTGSPDEAELTAEEKRAEMSSENTVEETAEDTPDIEDNKEHSEKKAEISSEEIPAEEHTEEISEHQEGMEAPQEESNETVQEKEEQVKQEEYKEFKEENNGPDKKSEPSNDKVTEKATEVKTYNNAVDSPPPLNLHASQKSTAASLSFIDEVIIDNMIKGKEDIIGHNPLSDVKAEKEVNQINASSTATHQDDKSGGVDKDAYLYDESVVAEQQSHLKENIAGSRDARDEQRVQIKVDMTSDQENEMRRSISENMSKEAIKAFYNQQAEAMREQLSIASAEFGIDEPVEIIGMQEDVQIEQPKTVPTKK